MNMPNTDIDKDAMLAFEGPDGPVVIASMFRLKDRTRSADFLRGMRSGNAEQAIQSAGGEAVYAGVIDGEFIAADNYWHTITLYRYPNWRTYRDLLTDDDVREKARDFRNQFLDDARFMLTTPLGGPAAGRADDKTTSRGAKPGQQAPERNTASVEWNRAALLAHERPDGPVDEVVLYRLRDGTSFADYVQDLMRLAAPGFTAIGGKTLYYGAVGGEFITGEDHWDTIAVTPYPDWRSFRSFFDDEDLIGRLNAIRRKYLADSRLMLATPSDTLP